MSSKVNRLNELHMLLGPGGKLSNEIYEIITRIKNSSDLLIDEILKDFDEKLEEYVQLRIEFHELTKLNNKGN